MWSFDSLNINLEQQELAFYLLFFKRRGLATVIGRDKDDNDDDDSDDDDDNDSDHDSGGGCGGTVNN